MIFLNLQGLYSKTYLVVKVHVNHVDVGTLLHLWSALHPETDMADTFHRVRFSKLFLHHCYDADYQDIQSFKVLPLSYCPLNFTK